VRLPVSAVSVLCLLASRSSLSRPRSRGRVPAPSLGLRSMVLAADILSISGLTTTEQIFCSSPCIVTGFASMRSASSSGSATNRVGTGPAA